MSRGLLWAVVAVIGVIVVVAIVVPPFVTGTPRAGGPAGLIGERAPVVALRDDAGAPVSLRRYRGKVVVMNLWATWCPPCRAEMPELQRFADTYGMRGVVVVGVNQGESAQRARAFVQALKIRFPVWLDDRQEYGRAFAALGLPTTVVVGRDGIVAGGYDGALTLAQMRAAVAGSVAR